MGRGHARDQRWSVAGTARSRRSLGTWSAATGISLLAAAPAHALFTGGAVPARYGWLAFAVFGAIIGLTMYVTWLASKRVASTQQFYAAGRSVSGLQNGWAIAGDYLSAASFLGIAGLISLYGYDGFMYSVGWLVAYITVLLVIADPAATSASTRWATSSPSATTGAPRAWWPRCPR